MMNRIDTFFGNDTRQAIDRAILPTRSYNQTKEPINYKPKLSRFKLKVWFNDGNSKVFFSYDRQTDKNGKIIVDEWKGLMKLLRLVHKYKGKYKCAMIFATLDQVPQTDKSDYRIEAMKLTPRGAAENDKIVFTRDGVLDVTKFS